MSNDPTGCTYNIIRNFMYHLIKISVQLFWIWNWFWQFAYVCYGFYRPRGATWHFRLNPKSYGSQAYGHYGNVMDDESCARPVLLQRLRVVTLFSLLWVPAVHSSYFMATVARSAQS